MSDLDRNELLRQLRDAVRDDPDASALVIGYLTQRVPTDELQDVVVAARNYRRVHDTASYVSLLSERYGKPTRLG